INSDLPVRIEFFGNQIESIRIFDIKTQRMLRFAGSVDISPAKENLLTGSVDTILDYLPDNALLILDGIDETEDIIVKISGQIREDVALDKSDSDSDLPLLEWPVFKTRIDNIKRKIILGSWDIDSSDKRYLGFLPFTSVPKYGSKLDVFIKDLKQKYQDNSRILIVSQQTERLFELLEQQMIPVQKHTQLKETPPSKTVTLIHGSITGGWQLDNLLTVFSDNDIFGLTKQQRRIKRRPVRHHKLIAELSVGDYAVHMDHGIGKFSGLTRILHEDTEREYLVLEYAAGDKLYVPTDQLDLVSRYIGSHDQNPRLTRLGTQEWAQAKKRIKKSVIDMAEELLQIYAVRDTISGFAFSPDNLWQRELESSFPYVETVDQLEAVKAVKGDMEIEKPMDRLICGDVGYGKTEIALRAAFKAVMDNKQVALLVPTTVLAQQHIITFRERLQAFPVQVESLSRFCNEEEQIRILNGLANGTVDICIGTHRILQKDVVINDLGLLIIDEEQRFGVAHKEHFKKLRKEIDVLTLSATPIPRTLHMSLAGIRDLSTMETPPEERLPINTYIGEYDEKLIREAVLRELERNGQVFFVHNRVHSIDSMAGQIMRLVPEAKVAVAHGRMKEDHLEKIMTDFINNRSDILLTTTIIESGLDMPNVNTLIINDSDKLGLTQLYQLRGRIGRGRNIAYAYFLFNKNKRLTSQARKRLETIYEATELGAGFSIAIKDLEIRGAGNILGAEQSGHIAAVGYDLYCRLLSDAINELRGKQAGIIESQLVKPQQINIDLPLDCVIPEDYISNINTRITYYKRLNSAEDNGELEDISEEIRDRYGILPDNVINLLYTLRIKQLAIKIEIESISTKDSQITLYFKRADELDVSIFPGTKNGVKIGSKQIKINIKHLVGDWQKELEDILRIMAESNKLL
ncbi:transcription-repair coupling factor, partial [Chloroflexota bacterium]